MFAAVFIAAVCFPTPCHSAPPQMATAGVSLTISCRTCKMFLQTVHHLAAKEAPERSVRELSFEDFGIYSESVLELHRENYLNVCTIMKIRERHDDGVASGGCTEGVAITIFLRQTIELNTWVKIRFRLAIFASLENEAMHFEFVLRAALMTCGTYY